MSDKLLIFGFGYSGATIADQAGGKFCEISGTTRSADKFYKFIGSSVNPHLFGQMPLDDDLISAATDATHIVISISPDENGDPVLGKLKDKLKNSENLKWIGYLSTVGVYGDHQGKWIDETTHCRPASKRSIQRLKAEQHWQDFARQMGVPLAIFRLSGIYGPGRNTFVNIKKGTARRLVKKDQVFNRIHRDDIGKAVNLAIEKKASGIFNITDDLPAPPQDVVSLGYELANNIPPEEIDFETAELSPMARSFYGENKRVSNQKSKQELGMIYDWPDYKVSLKKMWETGNWR